MRKLLVLFVSIIFILGFEVKSQEIQIEVNINVEQLEFEARNYVSNMKRDIENYVNNQKFTQNDWEGPKIPVQMTIYLAGGSNNRYSAKMFLISTRPIDGPGERQSVNLKLFDNQWSFEYGLGANLTYNPLRFDAFTSLIDYYMLLIIGFDLDTWEELGGNSSFSEVRKIVELGISQNAEGFTSNSAPGDFTKFNLTSELSNMRFFDFRKLLFSYYVDGLDLMEKQKEQAMKNLKNFIYELALYKRDKLVESSVLMQLFFDTKAQEIASIFNGVHDDEVFQNLKYLDPSNSTLYDDAKAGKLSN